MANEGKTQITDLGEGMEQVSHPADNPYILAQVDYTYVTYAQIIATASDVRIAFGDRRPPIGDVKPLIGLTMPHDVALHFVEMVAKLRPAIERARSFTDQTTVKEIPAEDQPS